MGKASILMVIGFSTALLMIGSHISKVSNSAMDNYLSYYRSTAAREIAAAGTNMAARALQQNMYWKAGFPKKSFMGGSFQTTVTVLDSSQVKVVTTSTYMDATALISVLLQRSSFSRFCYYSVSEMGRWWYGGDTVWGPMHTQDYLSVQSDALWGDPVFMDRATSRMGLKKSKKTDTPRFLGGFEGGVNIPMPINLIPLRDVAKSGGKYISGGDSVVMNFMSNGKVKWKSGTQNNWNVDWLSTLAPNGAIYVDGANVRISGTLSGRLTLGAGGTTGSTKQGNIYIDDNVVLNNDPRKGLSTDMLGLVAENDVIIADNAANKKDIQLQASIFCRSGSFTAQNYASIPLTGTIYLLGGIINNKRGGVGTFDPDHGYMKSYKYDARFLYDAPPFFPMTGNYEVVSWFE